mmetsp:Transcript_5373/g.6876  ORF Transcript_5373/g.6876 Transcript_5373/m.6876 type:complete len:469 (+) Transcript_5373:34-1440(+)
MGRKKGKQRGQFSSKSKQAAHLVELHQDIRETHIHHGRKKSKNNSNISCNNNNSELAKFRNDKRNAVNLTQLRGLLRERLFEDRERDANIRRQMTITNLNSSTNTSANNNGGKNREGLHPVGWILTYNHQEAMAGIDQSNDLVHDILLRNNNIGSNSPPSLQCLCTQTMSVYLREYIISCGEEYVHDRLSLLPSNVIEALSSCCRDVTDQMAYVLGRHNHLESLVLCASSSNNSSEERNVRYNASEEEMLKNSNTLNRSENDLTDTGILSLTKNVMPCELSNSNDIISWEDMDREDNYDSIYDADAYGHNIHNFQGHCLKRLEVRNFQTRNMGVFIRYLSHNPFLTHICLSKSFDELSGPNLLFCRELDEKEDCYDYDYNRKLYGGNILRLLPNLQILDLSGCTWVHFDLLHAFLQYISYGESGHTSLEMILVNQCCSYLTKSKCAELNTLTRNRPYVCMELPKHAIF